MRIKYLLFLLLLVTGGPALAQEVLVDLTCNPLLVEHAKKLRLQKDASKNTPTVQGGVLTLPFIEDFSGEDPYPDATKWQDSNVYINRTFPKAPPTLGVATFDGLKANGLAYNINVPSGSSGYADTLTSNEIDLSAITDSVYFSFFYQAQGRGNAPETQDSLILQFKEQGDTLWTTVWSRAGYQLPSTDSSFNYVHLYVPTQYYYGNFQFRFLNRATLSGNVDHWHIDYVHMDRPRTWNEPADYYDAAMVYPTARLLKEYTAMPYRQYTTAHFDSTYWNPIRNNADTVINVTYTIAVRNAAGAMLNPNNTATGNILPYDSVGYTTCPFPGCGPILNNTINNYVVPLLSDSAQFIAVQKISTPTADIIKANDSVRTFVNLYNYFAYDDGSAEAAWGISSAFSMVGYKFTLTTPDTLRAVSVFWNPYVTNVEPHGIRITVWNDAGGEPGQIMYQTGVEYPLYQEGFTNFQYFMLDTILNLSGTFYIGYMQIDPETLSVGMDMNSNAQSKIFYNTSGSWLNTTYKGALMMRPHFGEAFVPVGVNEARPEAASFNIYPNPANDRIYISGKGTHSASKVNVFDAFGRRVLPEELINGDHSLDVSQLPSGIYFIRIETAGSVSAHRVVITR